MQRLQESLGEDIKISLSREISKKFEEHIRGTVTEVIAQLEAKPGKGEMVLVINN